MKGFMKARSIRKTLSAKSSRLVRFEYMKRIKSQNEYSSFGFFETFGLLSRTYIEPIKSKSTREYYAQILLKFLSRKRYNIGYYSRCGARLVKWRIQ